ncbi:MAG: Tat pathway signal protein [Clostridia bacterium]|nr:Tat pathway signal protein [Clostridia bacterium]
MASKPFMWTYFIQLGSNMWNDVGNTRHREHRSTPSASETFLFDRGAWNEHTEMLRDIGVNTLVIDIGEALRYERHPEINVKGSWDHETMRAEAERLRAMGFELIPKLNFSACHDVWLGEYSRMLSTKPYYEVCRDVIDEVCEVFRPAHFHLGMDEETAANQRFQNYCVVRQYDLWWHDFYYLVECVERNNARPWIWSDYGWNNEELFFQKMPREVLQNNWYYSGKFADEETSETQKRQLALFDKLDAAGFDQVPTGSIFGCRENIEGLTKYAVEHISEEHLFGIMQSSWERTDPDWMHIHRAGAETLAAAKKWYESR